MLEPKKEDYTHSELNFDQLTKMVRQIESDIDKIYFKKLLLIPILLGSMTTALLLAVDYHRHKIDVVTTFIDNFWVSFIFVGFWWFVLFIFNEQTDGKYLSDTKSRQLKALLSEYQIIRSDVLRFETDHNDWRYFNLINQPGYWLTKKAQELEEAFALLLVSRGYDVQKTKVTGDGGVDLICQARGKTIFIQCKGYAKKLGVGAIRDAAGVLATRNPDKMVVMCPAGFTKGSHDFAHKSGVVLLSVKEIIEISNDRFGFF